MDIDVFSLHDGKIDDSARKFIVVYGENIREELSAIISRIKSRGISGYRLFKMVKNELKISDANAQRLVYLRRSWYPLVFIDYILNLDGSVSKPDFQKHIELIRSNHPPLRVLKAPKTITENLCKIAGAHAADGTMRIGDNGGASAYISIVDRNKESIEAYAGWIWNEFGLKLRVRKSEHSKDMWQTSFHSKVVGRYLNRVFGFPSGSKVYTVTEPEIIKRAGHVYGKAFAVGFLTFEGGVGIKKQVELMVASQSIRDSIHEILVHEGLDVRTRDKSNMNDYWRLWSTTLNRDETLKWMEFFEPNTEKWFKLYEYCNGFQGKPDSFEGAVKSFDSVFPKAGKTSVSDVIKIIRDKNEIHRYALQDAVGMKCTWAHSVSHYLHILSAANAIRTEKRSFGNKKSFGSIIREVYIYNPDVKSWKVPYRPRFEEISRAS
jgi:hypothetical protein